MLQMKFSKRMASIAVVAALSIAGLTAVTLAAGHDGRWSHSAWAGEGKKMCDRGEDRKYGKHGGRGHHGPMDPDYLAKKLSVMETEIGIRADQLDTWRDFTDALQATLNRPMRPGGHGMTADGDTAEPFSLAEGFADRSIERAQNAEKLKAAIGALRTTLTAEQLDKVKEIEARVRARMAMHRGWRHGPHGGPGDKGPHGKGPHGKGPHGGPPQAGPDGGPDDSPGDTPEDEGEED
jgi:hypothetical protein